MLAWSFAKRAVYNIKSEHNLEQGSYESINYKSKLAFWNVIL